MKQKELIALVLKQFYEEISRPADTPKEKYNQLALYFKECAKDPKEKMDSTIRHALLQSTLVGFYSGFSLDFWSEVMGEHLNAFINVAQ